MEEELRQVAQRSGRESFGELLRDRRRELELSQVEVAERLVHIPGCSQSHISQYERGRRAPSVEQLGGLADVLDLDEEAIATAVRLLSETARFDRIDG